MNIKNIFTLFVLLTVILLFSSCRRMLPTQYKSSIDWNVKEDGIGLFIGVVTRRK